jgi:tetratricopeptide (TPR) repeat protein
MYGDEYTNGHNARPDPLPRALDAALRAVKLDPANQMAYYNLAYVRYILKQVDEFIDAAEHAVALNPNDSEVLGFMGVLMQFVGRYERGLAWSRKAVALDPNPPGWHYFAFVWDHYRRGNFEEALVWARKVNMTDFYWYYIGLAAVYGQLGRKTEAQAAIERIYALRPDFDARTDPQMPWAAGEELAEKIREGLRKGGMQIDSGLSLPAPTASTLIGRKLWIAGRS